MPSSVERASLIFSLCSIMNNSFTTSLVFPLTWMSWTYFPAGTVSVNHNPCTPLPVKELDDFPVEVHLLFVVDAVESENIALNTVF